MEEYQLHQLENGIRIAYKQVLSTNIIHCGMFLNVGSRDEKPHQTGMAHFWEHMAFKGTEKRNSYYILNRLESVGGELNAFTTKEKICFYASVLEPHAPKAIELLTDITFNSIFPEKQIELEKQVILEEMSSFSDAPEEAISDDFDNVIFEGHQLSENILGKPETLKSFTKKDLLEFIEENLSTDKIVFSIVGKTPFKKIIEWAEKYLGNIPKKITNKSRIAPSKIAPINSIKTKEISQAYVAIGRRSYDLEDAKRIPFFSLINYLGGPNMNSRLNLALREKYGLVYSVDAAFHPFTDCGYYGIYYATEPQNLKKTERLIENELKKICDSPLKEKTLKLLKEQLKGQLAMSEESNQGYMLMMAKSILDLEKVEPINLIFEKIDAISSLELMEMANEMFLPEQLSSIKFLPKNYK